jgi:hypothetical protein
MGDAHLINALAWRQPDITAMLFLQTLFLFTSKTMLPGEACAKLCHLENLEPLAVREDCILGY